MSIVRPVVGFESRIGMTDHLSLVPGIRLVGLQQYPVDIGSKITDFSSEFVA